MWYDVVPAPPLSTLELDPSTISCRTAVIAGSIEIDPGPFLVSQLTFCAAPMHLTCSPEKLSPVKFSPAERGGLYYLQCSLASLLTSKRHRIVAKDLEIEEWFGGFYRNTQPHWISRTPSFVCCFYFFSHSDGGIAEQNP